MHWSSSLSLIRPSKLDEEEKAELELTGSTLAFMMRTFGAGFGDITHYFNYYWASIFYLFEALTMPPVEVGPA
jgi:hypothetical protein